DGLTPPRSGASLARLVECPLSVGLPIPESRSSASRGRGVRPRSRTHAGDTFHTLENPSTIERGSVMFRPRLFTICALAIAACGATARAQDAKKPTKAATAAPPALSMEEAMAKYCTPGAQHQTLAKLEGKWTTSTKMWMDPGQPPTTSDGTAEFTMVLGGRFL